MSKRGFTRRRLLQGSAVGTALAGAGAFFGPWTHNRAYAQGKPIKLGLTCDASGQYGNSGQDDLRGIKIAIEEFNAKGGVLGRKIEWITADTETNPATGTRIAERFIREDCSILIGALHSGVANAISQVANKYGTIYLNTNSSAPSEAGENCSRIKFVWDGNGTNFAKAAVRSAVKDIGKNWLLLTNDYVWGHTTSAATKTEVEAAGGSVVDDLLVPQNTRDFTAYLLKIQQIKPDVVAAAVGGDDIKALRAAGRPAQARRQAGLDQQPAGLAGHLGPAREPVRRVRHQLVPQARAAGRAGVRRDLEEDGRRRRDPGAGQRLLQRLHGDARAAAGDRAGRDRSTTSRSSRRSRATRCRRADRMQDFDAYIDAEHPPGAADDLHGDAATRSRRTRPTIFEILARTTPEEALDTASAAKCKLVPYEQVPTVDA